MPPAPIAERISYGPRRVPGVSAKWPDLSPGALENVRRGSDAASRWFRSARALEHPFERRLLDLRPDVPALGHGLEMPDVHARKQPHRRGGWRFRVLHQIEPHLFALNPLRGHRDQISDR